MVKWTDVKSRNVYPSLFNGRETPGLNAWLQLFQMWTNFTSLLASRDAQPESFYTTCKMQFLVLYAVTRSLAALKAKPPVTLTPASEDAINDIINIEGASTFLSDSGHMLRTTLMHYKPDSRIDDASLDPGALMFGLTETLFDGMTPTEFRRALDAWGAQVREAFDAWTA